MVDSCLHRYFDKNQEMELSSTRKLKGIFILEGEKMLTKPQAGWSDFSLEGTSVYGLSYLTDVGIEWVEQAVHGLETLCPFCVCGNLEPGRMLCVVSYWNCYIFYEHEGSGPVKENKDKVFEYLSHTSMIDQDFDEKRQRLAQRLERLRALIDEKRVCFGPNRFFT